MASSPCSARARRRHASGPRARRPSSTCRAAWTAAAPAQAWRATGNDGVHVVRLGSAMKRRVITGGQFVEALQSAVVFTGATIIRPDDAR